MSEKRVVKIMILFYSRFGNTANMAEEIAYGAGKIRN
jgi:flavodoxin